VSVAKTLHGSMSIFQGMGKQGYFLGDERRFFGQIAQVF
jgi:hypothetical protein